jgi:hypothetical protein
LIVAFCPRAEGPAPDLLDTLRQLVALCSHGFQAILRIVADEDDSALLPAKLVKHSRRTLPEYRWCRQQGREDVSMASIIYIAVGTLVTNLPPPVCPAAVQTTNNRKIYGRKSINMMNHPELSFSRSIIVI